MLRYIVLGLLRRGERIHGYALWKLYERRSRRTVQSGKFYRALKSLAEHGLIRPLAPPEGDPRRTPYEITPAGRSAFDCWVVAVDELDSASEDGISSRGLFALEFSPEVAAAFFAGLEDLLSARWKRLEHERERTLSRPGIAEVERQTQSLLLVRKLERTSADLKWLHETRDLFSQLNGSAPRRAAGASEAPRSRMGTRSK